MSGIGWFDSIDGDRSVLVDDDGCEAGCVYLAPDGQWCAVADGEPAGVYRSRSDAQLVVEIEVGIELQP